VTLGVALFTGFSTIPMMCLGGALNSMAIDYNDYLYHNKIVGMSASATSFGAKIASGLGASLIGWILAAVHYDASTAAATTSVRYGIYGFSIYLPLLMMVGLYLMIRKFDLEAKYPEMMAEIKARNEAEAATEKTVE
ncbi:MAG: MFS transporter, partial [Lachnospiraceae bacterium]|nr:MFS transporter [Lachnospiraceae bacterium]